MTELQTEIKPGDPITVNGDWAHIYGTLKVTKVEGRNVKASGRTYLQRSWPKFWQKERVTNTYSFWGHEVSVIPPGALVSSVV